jgi:membrane-associated phospholipid phosphatase
VPPDFVDRMSQREASAVDHSPQLSPDRPAWPVTAVSAATGGGALWLAIAAVMATQPGPLRLAAREGACAVIAANATSHALAHLVGRPRPPAGNLPAYQALAHHPTSPSFPSTHTAMAAAFTTAVLARHRGWGLALTPIAVLVAYSRVRTRAHWPTDVVAGGLCGALIGAAVHTVLRP